MIIRSYVVTLCALLFVSCGTTVAQSVAVFDFELIDTSLEGAIRGAWPDPERSFVIIDRRATQANSSWRAPDLTMRQGLLASLETVSMPVGPLPRSHDRHPCRTLTKSRQSVVQMIFRGSVSTTASKQTRRRCPTRGRPWRPQTPAPG